MHTLGMPEKEMHFKPTSRMIWRKTSQVSRHSASEQNAPILTAARSTAPASASFPVRSFVEYEYSSQSVAGELSVTRAAVCEAASQHEFAPMGRSGAPKASTRCRGSVPWIVRTR